MRTKFTASKNVSRIENEKNKHYCKIKFLHFTQNLKVHLILQTTLNVRKEEILHSLRFNVYRHFYRLTCSLVPFTKSTMI